MSIKHSFVNPKTPTADPTIVGSAEWNATHVIDSATITTTMLATTGVTAGSYTNANLTVGVDGRVTSVASGTGGGSTPIAALTIAGNNTGTTQAAIGLTDVQAQAIIGIDTLSVKDSTFGAKGDGVTDDRAAIQAAVNAAISANKVLRIPPGNYKLSGFIDVSNARGLRILGSPFATLTFPSDDTSVHASGNANSDNQARSAFLVRYSTNVVFDGLVFQGGTNIAFDTVNLGCAVYAGGHCQGVTLQNCQTYDGNSIYQHDQITATTSTGASLTAASGVVTLVSSFSVFSAGHVGAQLMISNTSIAANGGVYVIASFVSPTTVTFRAAGVTSESSSFNIVIDDADRGTTLLNCRSVRARSVVTLPDHSRVLGCEFRQPLTHDLTGIPITFAQSGSITTLSCVNGSWQPEEVIGRWVNVMGSTSSANDGLYQITAATARTRFAPATIAYTNASGVVENGSLANGGFCIFRGERSGKGAGASALSKSGSVVTLTSSTAAFSGTDVGKAIRIARATTLGNNGVWTVASVPSSTTVTFANSVGASETFSGAWSLDGYDSTGPSGAAFGSTHAIYVFAGRSDIEVAHCTFEGIRKNCVKASGSATPIRQVTVHHNRATECGALFTGGADDAQEHSEIHCDDNILTDCGIGRPGWGEGVAITFLGSKGATADRNKFYYRRPSVSAVDGRASTAGLFGILASRYVNGKTQPIEDFSACDNRGVADRVNTRSNALLSALISVANVGLTNYWGSAANSPSGTSNTAVTLTVSGGVVTLVDSAAAFSQDLVNAKIQIVAATTAANNVTATVTSVLGTSTLTFANGAGVTEAFPTYGAYRILRTAGARGAGCRLNRNFSDNAAATCLSSTSNVGPEMIGNAANGGAVITEGGSVTPVIHLNHMGAASSSVAGIQISSTTSWPIVYDNFITNGALASGALVAPQVPQATRGDMGVGVDSFTRVDHPLLGKRGRVVPTGGRPEAVFSFGSVLVEGDTFSYDGAAITYTDNPSPTYPKFHAIADLVASFPHSGVSAADYGAKFATPVTTGHVRFYFTNPSTSAGVPYLDTINVLNPTALVFGRNATGGGEAYLSGVGEEVVTSDVHLPIWSPLAGYGGVLISADKSPTGTATTGAALIAGGYYVVPDVNNAGAVAVVTTVNAAIGNEELRWMLP